MIPRTDRPDQWSDFLHGNSVGTGNQFCCCKAGQCDRSVQTSYMTGYSPAVLSASSFSRSVSCEPHQLLHTFHGGIQSAATHFFSTTEFSSVTNEIRPTPRTSTTRPCQRIAGSAEEPPERNLVRCSLNRLQSPGFHWTFINGMSRSSTFREGQSSWVHSCNILYILPGARSGLVLLSYLFQSLRFLSLSVTPLPRKE